MLTGFIRESPLRELYAHWRKQGRNGRVLPDRRRMDMPDLPVAVLPHAFIYELTEDRRFRCRLAGTRFADDLGYDPTGRHLDEMMDPVLGRSRLALYEECVAAPLALYYRARLSPVGQEHRESGRLLLPVSDAHGSARFVFGGMIVTRLAKARSEGAQTDGMIETHRDPAIGAAGRGWR